MPQFEVNISFNAIGPEQSKGLPGIIFLHEVAFSKETWNHCLKPIANETGRMVVTYDARNHGDSGWTHNFSYQHMMEDLWNVMEFLGMSKAILIGHGMGGKTAIDFALKHSEKVDQLVVEDMTLQFQPPGEREFCLKYIDLLKESLHHIPADVKELDNAKNFLASYIQERIPKEYRSEHIGEIEGETIPLKIDEKTGKFEWKLNLEVLRPAVQNCFQTEPEVDGYRIFKYEGEFQGPALFLCGERSPYKILNDMAFTRDRVKNATFTVIDGAGHLIHTDKREGFCEEVIRFINSN